MKVSALVATDKRTNSIVFAEGIEDSSTSVQVLVPRELFTVEEINEFKKDELPYSARQWDLNPTSNIVNLGESDAYNLTCDLTNLKIEIREFDIQFSDLLHSTNYENKSEISVFVIYKNENNELMLAEGTDSDGYAYHQFNLNGYCEFELLSDDDSIQNGEYFLKDMLNKEVEVRHITGKYKNITISMRRILIPQ